MIYSYHSTAYSDRYFSSIKHRLLSPRLHASISSSCIAKTNLVIAHITYDFIHNYFLNSRFVMQDGITRRSVKSKKRFCVLSSSTSDSSTQYIFQCIGLSQRLSYCLQLFVPHPPSWLFNKDLPHVGLSVRICRKWFWISEMSELRSAYSVG
jgi:hypothetical protein